jgi:hypothetical protein
LRRVEIEEGGDGDRGRWIWKWIWRTMKEGGGYIGEVKMKVEIRNCILSSTFVLFTFIDSWQRYRLHGFMYKHSLGVLFILVYYSASRLGANRFDAVVHIKLDGLKKPIASISKF